MIICSHHDSDDRDGDDPHRRLVPLEGLDHLAHATPHPLVKPFQVRLLHALPRLRRVEAGATADGDAVSGAVREDGGEGGVGPVRVAVHSAAGELERSRLSFQQVYYIA